MVNKRVVVVDDNVTIKVVVYHDALGIAVELTPQRALALAASLLDAARRRLRHTQDPNDDPTGLKLFP